MLKTIFKKSLIGVFFAVLVGMLTGAADSASFIPEKLSATPGSGESNTYQSSVGSSSDSTDLNPLGGLGSYLCPIIKINGNIMTSEVPIDFVNFATEIDDADCVAGAAGAWVKSDGGEWSNTSCDADHPYMRSVTVKGDTKTLLGVAIGGRIKIDSICCNAKHFNISVDYKWMKPEDCPFVP